MLNTLTSSELFETITMNTNITQFLIRLFKEHGILIMSHK